MSSSGAFINSIKREDVTAWTLDIEMQTLQAEILALKKNLTDANVKQIEEKEGSIAEKKNALEKHCRHLGMTYGNYGAQENGHKLEDTNGETGAMTNGHVKDVHGSADVMMDDGGTAIPTNSVDAARSAALDEINFPQLTAVNIPNNFDGNSDPFVTPGDYATTDMFHAPTGTYVDHFGTSAGDYTHAFINNPIIHQNLGRTDSSGKPVIDVDEYLMQTDGVIPANYATSAGRVADHGMGLGGDYEMDMDAMIPRAPVAEHDESVISGMDK
ncbi:hypothetical protein M436DRAFT_66653 [Aureobasidium namibiae CBS 147.97]|uniref:Uncharacterized protein n=1 Tax=Aureobasidium namibiae CBS 147.97 TaxID=1043004 RepID=A0A074WKB8_9PEZI